jgi:uncharacterized repeat protein (TIGR03943 family)
MKVLDARAASTRRLGGPRAWSHPRLATATVLGAWSATFWFLLLSGRTNLYLSTRASWIVPAGAIVLGISAVGILLAGRVGSPRPIRRGQAVTSVALLLPVVLVLASPPSTLGSFSAQRKASFSGKGLQTFFGTFDERSEITLLFVAAAQFWPGGTELLAERAGSDVEFVGFVRRNADTPADEFLLTRFVVSCCVADATVTQVRVVNVPAGAFADDEWVEVRGQIYPVGTEIIVTADTIESVPAPEVPYLSP